ncbi:MAG: glutamate 5-kinase [Phycisphaera sp.]|nr:glutamate 5-kinase [Phycisphaera sp.]
MSSSLRQSMLSSAKRIVIKIGTQVLTGDDGQIDQRYLADMARQVAGVIASGCEVAIVSSGAIGAGVAELGLSKRPTDVSAQQAVAAVGQRRLMTHMHEAFAPHNMKVGQILLTRSDFDDRNRFLNIRNCVTHLHKMGCVPIINENDTVAVEELRFGDNDQLSAMICHALRADALILFSVVDGLLDEKGKVIDHVDDVTHVLGLARSDRSARGTGGMKTKLEAARLVMESGELAVIAHGRERDVLLRILAGEEVGTFFSPAPRNRKMDSRERWIGLTKRPAGTITIDDGATAALRDKGKSLLATGVTDATGMFDRGDVLLVRDARGGEVARGLTNYSADELRLIMGKKSSQFAKLLGRMAYAEVIHRDNLVVTSRPGAE